MGPCCENKFHGEGVKFFTGEENICDTSGVGGAALMRQPTAAAYMIAAAHDVSGDTRTNQRTHKHMDITVV